MLPVQPGCVIEDTARCELERCVAIKFLPRSICLKRKSKWLDERVDKASSLSLFSFLRLAPYLHPQTHAYKKELC